MALQPATNNAGDFIFDVGGTPLFDDGHGGIVNQAGVAQQVDAGTGDPQDAGGANILQPGNRLAALMQYVALQQTRLNAAQLARLGAIGPVPPVVPPAVVFARNPGRVNRNIIDMNSKGGKSLHSDGCKSLYGEKELFNLDTESLMMFLDAVQRRSRSQGWQIFDIPNGANPAVNKNLLTEHGELTLENIRAYIEPIITAHNSREEQEDEQLFDCLFASITKEAAKAVTLRDTEYTIQGEYSGLMLLKIIISEAYIETKSTVNLMLTKLTAELPKVMAEHGNNVKDFNNDIRETIKRLQASNAAPGNILPQLLKVYKNCDSPGSEFSFYIRQLENSYNDGSVPLTDKTMMAFAQKKYEELVEAKTYTGKSEEDKAIIALEAKVEQLNKQLKENSSSSGNTSNSSNSGNSTGNSNRQKNIPKWITTAPKDGESRKKTVNGKTYHWCTGGTSHKPKWVIHEPKDCKGKGTEAESDNKDKSSEESSSGSEKSVKWSTAMLARASDGNREE